MIPAAAWSSASSHDTGRRGPPLRDRARGVVSRPGPVSRSADVQPLRHRPPRLVGKSRACTVAPPPATAITDMPHCNAQYGQWVAVGRDVDTPTTLRVRRLAAVPAMFRADHMVLMCATS